MTTREKCKDIWRLAMMQPVHLSFPSLADLERARMTLYNARRTDHLSQEELKEFKIIKDQCEIVVNKRAMGLTVQRKDQNPFHTHLENVLDEALSGVEVSKEQETQKEIEESLQKVQELEEKSQEEATRSTPYYNREG